MAFDGTKFISVSQFTSDGVEYSPAGTAATVQAGTSQNIDITCQADSYLTGIVVSCKNAAFGDSAILQGVHPIAGVVKQFGTSYFMTKDGSALQVQVNEDLPYCSAIPQGLILRLVYTSVGAENPQVVVNYKLHKAI